MNLKPHLALALVLACPFFTACVGYQRLDRQPHKAAWTAQGETVRIASFRNNTQRLGLDETFRRALEHRIVSASPWKLVGQSAASRWVLQGSIEKFEVRTLAINLGTSTAKGAAGTASRVEVIITGSMQLLDGQTGTLVVSRPSFTFSDQYRVDQNFASFTNREVEVLDTLADDFAESFLTQLMEGSD